MNICISFSYLVVVSSSTIDKNSDYFPIPSDRMLIILHFFTEYAWHVLLIVILHPTVILVSYKKLNSERKLFSFLS